MGGLLSLGLGMSFISFIELGNFLCNRFIFQKHSKKIDSKKVDLETALTVKRSSVPRIFQPREVCMRRHSVSTAITSATTNSISSLSEIIPYNDF